MENITLGQIASWVAMIGGLITGGSLIVRNLKKWLTEALNEKFNGIDVRLDEMKDQIEDADMNSTKNFLVQCLADIESGKPMDDSLMQRFWEQYDHYKDNGGNSYIREKVHSLRERGKL